ncbi:DUF1565 domain-containing protein [Pleurocapsales cyanobacterium LEGE 10410]|nr:DUF1565 domain-containing protein [Pleurocapsales cyanobacterium LEGE 10410]
MASRENRVYRSCFIKLLKKDQYVPWLLVGLCIALPCSITLQQPIAQAETVQSLTLDKNTIYVHPQQGDDSQGGKKTSPLKTITQALKIAPAGSKIQLASGTYSEETGETFPLIVKNKITLQGDRRSQGQKVIIRGNGYFTSPTGAGQNVAIAALNSAGGITGVTVTNDHSRGHGLWIESASPDVIGNTFTRNGNTGLSVNGNSSPLIEGNYFYNNSGNGLLVYGTSQPEIVDNTFKQTGFGVSLVQDTVATLTGNLFDSNRIGIILEGNSQGILRDNEIINSSESGLTAIAQSRVDLGTSSEPGNNVFRSNRKLDIENATQDRIVAVGTETQGKIVGEIDFDRGEFIATNNTKNTFGDLPPLLSQDNLDDRPIGIERNTNSDSIATDNTFRNLPPLPSQNNLEGDRPTTPSQTATSLPSPPPIPENNNSNKELVFTAPSIPEPEPVPYLPQTSNSALSSNDSRISSLSDVLGSSASRVRYKVLVEALNESEENEVRSLYPQAFETVFDGQSWLQVGAFSNRDKAKQAERTLVNLGLETYLLE